MRLLEDQEKVLERIQGAFAKQKNIRDEIAALEWFHQQNKPSARPNPRGMLPRSNVASLRSAAEAWHRRETELKQQNKEAEKDLASGHELMRSTP